MKLNPILLCSRFVDRHPCVGLGNEPTTRDRLDTAMEFRNNAPVKSTILKLISEVRTPTDHKCRLVPSSPVPVR